MSLAILFWILYIIGVVLHGWGFYRNRDSFEPSFLLLWVLLGLLGYKAFGWG